MSEFIEIIKNRKSIRSFSKKDISPELIACVIKLATYAPTNCNQQLWNFIVIDKAEIKERLIKEACSNTLFRRAPIIIAVTYDGWNYKEAIQGASMATENFLLAASYYGLGVCSMNSYGADTKVKKILNIPSQELIGCFIALGYSDDKANQAPLVPRRPVSEVIHWNKFDNKKKPPFTYHPNDWDLDDLKQHQKYYCRKTFLGKEMDIMSQAERDIIKSSLSDVAGPVIDICSYDGSYLREFPHTSITCVDLTHETSAYTKVAANSLFKEKADHITYQIYNDQGNNMGKINVNVITLLYKLERLPDSLREKVLSQTYNSLAKDGKFIIIARKSNMFLKIFFFIIKLFFGHDLRKTGIYNFFGPYKPINLSHTLTQLKKAGFKRIQWSGYFFFPPFYEQVYQMFIQYIKSSGSSYLNREKQKDFISSILAKITKLQKFKKAGRLGSIAIIICQK